MRRAGLVILSGMLIVGLGVEGCQPHSGVLTASNYLQKFDEIEQASVSRPGTLTREEIETVLGPGQPIEAGDPVTANLPPGMLSSELKWCSWEYNNETIIVGFAVDRATSVSRLRL